MSSDLHQMFHGPEYHWWRRALVRDRLDTQDEAIECGLYRWRNARVKIWLEESGEKRVKYDGVDQDLDKVMHDWVSISRNPVTPDAYNVHLETGIWPGGNEVATAVMRQLSNNPPPDDTPEALQATLDELEREAKRLIEAGAATTQTAADEAAKVTDALAAVGKASTDRHRVLKAPHLEAGRTLDRLWFPLAQRADDLRAKLKAIVLLPFLRQDEAKKQAENAVLVSQGVNPSHIDDPRPKAAGSTRTVSLRTKISAEITDYDKLVHQLKEQADVRALIQSIADRSARAGVELPGMKIKRERVAV